MKPRRHLSNKLSAVGASTLLSLALTGITCGSFAWFAYTTRAKIEEFRGVTIGVNELEMGLLSEVELEDAEQYHLIKDDSNPEQTIYWLDGHIMEPETINYALRMNGYATDTLIPATTKKYAPSNDFKLYSAPRLFSNEQSPASKIDYIYLPLVFRSKDIIDEGYVSNENIYLSQVSLNVLNANSHIHESVRIFTNNKIDNNHLINPSSSDNGSTAVGGTLDLNGDGFYDVDHLENGDFEHIYGEAKEHAYAPPTVDDDPIFDTTFHSGHKAGAHPLETIVPEVAEYEGMYEFRNKRKHVTTTNPLTDNLAYLDLSIFVEGWDLSVIDSEIEIPFSMELKFEIVF